MKDMREVSGLLDDTIAKGCVAMNRGRDKARKKRTELRKALSYNPNAPVTVGPDSVFYSPYRHTSFGWMPYDQQHWKDQGVGGKTATTDQARVAADGYREVRQFFSGMMKSIQETVEKAGLPEGTIHDYNGHKYEKKGPGDWQLVHEGKAGDHPVEQDHGQRTEKVQTALKDRKDGKTQEPTFDDRAREANDKAREVQTREGDVATKETDVRERGLDAREADLESQQAGPPEKINPDKVTPEQVANHIAGATPDEKSLDWMREAHLQTIEEHGKEWSLKKIPLDDKVKHKDIHAKGDEWDKKKVDKYAEMYKEGEGPPLVVGKDGSVQDGVHRATAAKRAGLTHHMAYVPKGGVHDEAAEKTAGEAGKGSAKGSKSGSDTGEKAKGAGAEPKDKVLKPGKETK